MMEDFMKRINQQREQEALLVAQREQELREQEQAAQEKEEFSPKPVFRQLIEEMCGTKVCEEQKQNMEDTMLDLLEDCRQKELYCIHNNVDDLIESALNSKLLLINLNSQRFDKEKQEVKNIESTIPLNKTPQISPVNATIHDLPTEEPEFKIKHAESEEVQELLSKLLQDLQSINEELAEYINTPSWNLPTSSYDDDDDEYSFATQEYLMTCSTAITPDSPKTDSLIMVDKHLDTIPETKSDEFIKSSVENLVQNSSESEDFSEDECECDVPDCDDSQTTNFSTFSNPLFDDSTSSDDESFSDEDVPKEIYSNPLFDEEIISDKVDASIISTPKIDSHLEQFSDKLAHIDPIPPGIEEADFDLEEEIRLVENLSYDNSSPRPPKEHNSENVDTIIESPSPSPIPVEDSDFHMEEIDLFLASDDSMPSGIENDDYDLEGDIRFLEELLSNDPLPLPKIESSNLDHFNDPSSPHPPPEPPDVEICFDVEPDTTVKNDFDKLNKDECFDPEGGEIDVFENVEDDDYFPSHLSFEFSTVSYLP
ncbi:hypothetical protein Tco_0303510 [Tanacetum coccineum]